MEKIDNFYEKFNGSYFVFIGIGISLLTKLIAVVLFMQVNPSFNLFSNYISDLAYGPNNSDIVYKFGVVISTIFYDFFFLYLMRFLEKRGGNQILALLSLLTGFIASVGAILVVVFTADVEPELHGLGATLYFFGNFFVLILFGTTEYIIQEIPRKLSISGFILAPLSFLFLSFYFLLSIYPEFSRELTIFTEWSAFFAIIAWLCAQGIYTIKM
ncbi:MAG: DUF998 domain-containing protein [Promethearchaeota archaeon]